jgi:outer membrane protein assembly factor BamB
LRPNAERLEDRIELSGLASSPWPIVGQNLQHTSLSPYVGAQTGALDWVTIPGVSNAARPVVVGNDGMYIEHVALNADGSLKWSLGDYGVETGLVIGNDGTLYCGAMYHSQEGVLAFNSNAVVDANHNLINAVNWFQPIGQVQGSPALGPDGTLYVGISSTANGLYAINSDTGAVKWTSLTRDSANTPAIGTDGTIYLGSCDQFLRALRPDGTQKWSYRLSGDVHGTPTVAPDGTILVTSSDWFLWAVNKDTGALKWKASLGGSKKSPINWGTDVAIAGNGQIYTVGYDGLYAFSSAGKLLWKDTRIPAWQPGGIDHNDPIVGHDNTVYVTGNGDIYALRPDRTTLWRSSSGNIDGAPAIGADGTVYVYSNDTGLLYAFKDDGFGRPAASLLRTKDSVTVVTAGASVTLGVEVADQTMVSSVTFSLDTNGNGALDTSDSTVGQGTYINSAASQSGWWTLDVTINATTPPGVYTYFAQALDNQGHPSNVVSMQLTVTAAASAPTLARTATAVPAPNAVANLAVPEGPIGWIDEMTLTPLLPHRKAAVL